MEFHPAPFTVDYFERQLSSGGRWHFGIVPQIFGAAVGLSRTDANEGRLLLYHCGQNLSLVREVLAAIGLILGQFPEDVSDNELLLFFPRCTRRPIDKDYCLTRLLALAKTRKTFLEDDDVPN